jgi:hypothetical protein
MTVTPDARRIAVFRRGICNGLNGKIPVGGQVDPNSMVGDNLLWRNVQKNEMKKNTSEIINRISMKLNRKVEIDRACSTLGTAMCTELYTKAKWIVTLGRFRRR